MIGREKSVLHVRNFREIGNSWKMDGSVENAVKIREIVHGIFEKSIGYEYYLEKNIMSTLKIDYTEEIKGRGCIACMITRRKADIAKVIMKRSALTHDSKIVKKRTTEQTKEEGLRTKREKDAFQIKSNAGNNWYHCDGSDYAKGKMRDHKTEEELILKERIKILEEELQTTKKVFFYLIKPYFYF